MRHDYVNVGKKAEKKKRKMNKLAPIFVVFACFFIGSFVLADLALNSFI
jgi:hypothetical protein